MKLIHCADLHLDSKIDTLPPEKSKIRREEIVRTFERLCSYATENGVTAVIIAGDMFDTKRITKKTAGKIFTAIKNSSDTEFLYLSGNHDEETFLKEENEELPSNFKIFGKEWTSFDFGDAVVTGITLDKVNSGFVYDTLNLKEDRINVVCMHGQIYGYNTSSESAEVINLPRLKGKNIDYLALGHIHSFSCEKLDDRGVYAYSGCLDGRGFDETGVKGFVLLDIENGKIADRFVPFCSRIFYTEEFSVSEEEGSFYQFADKTVKELLERCDRNGLIKVVVKGERNADFEVDKDDLTDKLSENFFFAKVYDRTTLKISYSDYAADKSVRGEFVRLVLDSDLSDEEKTAVLSKGLNALKGEL